MKPKDSVAPHSVVRLLWFIGLVALSLILAIDHGNAQSEEELKLLRMFYKEKDLFTSATHHAKPVSQIAENVTVVTGKEIEAMNAHTVAEVLNRVAGIFVNFHEGIGSVGSSSLLNIQGAAERHVLVLVDGISWNLHASGAAETNSIPVGIIERIEIIKGPASSAWGSALGGVIHIITKSAGASEAPSGRVEASYGEMDTQAYSAQIAGREGKLGYYLFGGRLDSDGPGGARAFENSSFYSKLSYAATDRIDLGLSLGLSLPALGLGEFATADIRSSTDTRTFWGTALLDVSLTSNLSMNLRIFRFEHHSDFVYTALGLGQVGANGDLFQESIYNEDTIGGTAQLVWEKNRHTAVAGVELTNGELEQTIDSGTFMQGLGAPTRLRTNPVEDNLGIYLNDTIVMDRFTVTPSIRYDYNSISEDFLSMSLGLAYRVGEETIVRGSVARGFTAPPLSWTSGGAFFLDANPDLKNEQAWSYQAGLETAALRYLWVKGTLFRHDVADVFIREPFAAGPPGYNDLIVNDGTSRRQGFELEAETVPFWYMKVKAGWGYVQIDTAADDSISEMYAANLGVVYDHPRIIRAELFGYYIDWDVTGAEYDDIIWDCNLMKTIYTRGRTAVELFLAGHNLFDGSQYLLEDNPNPGRWVEAGLRMRF